MIKDYILLRKAKLNYLKKFKVKFKITTKQEINFGHSASKKYINLCSSYGFFLLKYFFKKNIIFHNF